MMVGAETRTADTLSQARRDHHTRPTTRRPALANDKDSISNLRTESSKTDKRKQSLYFPESMLQEIKEEAARLDRSLSWVVQRAWKISRLEIKKLPSVNEVDGGDDDDEG
jgi:uncharacterized small protein (TIGR04563 family)